MNKITLPISGMHCRSCEILIEKNLLEVEGIEKVEISYKLNTATIYYRHNKPDTNQIEKTILEAGYKIGQVEKKPWFSKNNKDYKELGIAFLIILGLWWIIKSLGLTNLNFVSTSNPSNLSIVILIGLTAGFSTCLALVGGLVLGIASRHAKQHPEATALQKFRPHLFFNLGRLLSYAFLGGILGAAGSVLQFSSTVLGSLTVIIGVVMLLIGSKLIGIFPRLENFNLTLPSSIGKLLGIKKHAKEYSHRNSMVLGALTFFLPCGFTQAMQLYAVSTGGFIQGSLVMGLFALGTMPGLLSVGGLTSAVKGIFAQRFFKAAGLVVILFAIFNISNGFNLTGFQVNTNPATNTTVNANDPNVNLENGVQVVRMVESNSGYAPNSFTIKKGIPVKWIIDVQAPYSCASSLSMSKYKINKNLVAGENIIEFTPTETGKIPFSCSMGMYSGKFNVVDENSAATANTTEVDDAPPTTSSCGSGRGCSCRGGGV